MAIHPGRLTWNKIIGVWKIIFLSKGVICMFHVKLPGCIQKNSIDLQSVEPIVDSREAGHLFFTRVEKTPPNFHMVHLKIIP